MFKALIAAAALTAFPMKAPVAPATCPCCEATCTQGCCTTCAPAAPASKAQAEDCGCCACTCC